MVQRIYSEAQTILGKRYPKERFALYALYKGGPKRRDETIIESKRRASSAYSKALAELAARHRGEYRELLRELRELRDNG